MFHLEPPTCDDLPLWEIKFANLQAPAVTLAVELGLFPLLAEKAVDHEEIGRSLCLRPRACEVLLAVLAGLGLLAQREGRFTLTPAARNFLLPDSPYYQGILYSREWKLYQTVREALLRDRDREPNTHPWLTGALELEDAREFTAKMHAESLPAAMAVARLGDFTGVRHLLDVGGGSGCFCVALAARHPEMRFTILELPTVCQVAQEYVAAAGMQARIDTHSANMFRDPWPIGADALFFSNIFHDWNPNRCLELARRSFETLPPGGRIYLHEALLNDAGDGPLRTALFSLQMMLGAEGQQYTARELRERLEACGFIEASVTPTYGYYSLMVARKPGPERRHDP
jgi:hypothetical protein